MILILEGRGGPFFLKLIQYYKKELSLIKVLYGHVSRCSSSFYKVSNIYQNIDLALENPTRKQNLNATMRMGHVKLTHTLVTRTNSFLNT